MGMMTAAIQMGLHLAGAATEDAASKTALSNNYEQLRKSWLGSEMNAADSLEQGGVQAGRLRQRGSQVLAQQQVAWANNGIEATVGTPADLASATALAAELDAQTAKNNARREALGHRRAADADRLKWKQMVDQESADTTARGIALTGSLLKDLTGGAKDGSKSSFLGG